MDDGPDGDGAATAVATLGWAASAPRGTNAAPPAIHAQVRNARRESLREALDGRA
jgi:hypothetical protein